MTKPTIPLVPLLLGLGGLIPFWGLALARAAGWGGDPLLIGLVLATYAATILAFLGGIRWGLAMTAPDREGWAGDLVVSVVPQLVGWGALALPDRWRLAVLALVLLALGPLDQRLVARGIAAPWFGRLRMLLSLGAGAALFVAALG